MVQFVASRTDAAEASLGVLTSSRGGTESLLLHTLVKVQAPVTVLLEARAAHADEAPFRVDAVLLAVVLVGGTLVNVPAGPPVSV